MTAPAVKVPLPCELCRARLTVHDVCSRCQAIAARVTEENRIRDLLRLIKAGRRA